MKTQDAAASSYDAKLQKANTVVSAFLQARKETPLSEEVFKQIIQEAGGINEESLNFFKEEDIAQLVLLPPKDLTSSATLLPPVLARQVLAILQEKEKSPEDPQHVSRKQADRMRFEQLLGYYKPDEDDTVSRKLKDLSKGLPIIVFLPEGGVDVETSVKILKEIRAGLGARPNNRIEVRGSYQRIYKVGENPDRVFDENPLYPGRPLRPDGVCDQLNRSWNGVDLEVRQFLFLGVSQTKEIKVTLDKAHDLLDLSLQPKEDALKKLKSRYQETAVLFQDLKTGRGGSLPTLKLFHGKAAQTSQPNDPFKKLA